MYVYVSKSNAADPTLVQLVKDYCRKKLLCEVIEYKGGKYSPDIQDPADIVIMVTEGFSAIVGKGQHSEGSRALLYKKPLYAIGQTSKPEDDSLKSLFQSLNIGQVTGFKVLDIQDYKKTAEIQGKHIGSLSAIDGFADDFKPGVHASPFDDEQSDKPVGNILKIKTLPNFK